MSRRSAGDGSLYYRADKQLWVAQQNGKYRYSKDKATAQKKLHELLTQAEESKPQNITVSTLMDQWLEYAKPNLKFGTVQRYTEAITVHINPNIGGVKLHKLDALTVERVYAGMLSIGLSPSTVNIVHTVLSSAFKRATKWKLVAHNVMQDVDPPKMVRKEVEVWTPQEVRRILAAARGDRLEALYVLALSTGARGGELCALQVQDYDAGKLRIRRTLVNNGERIGTPKSKNSRRDIQLPSIAREALDRHLPTVDGGVWMFPSKAGTNHRYHNFIRLHWRPLLQRASVSYRNFHVCRHYVVSELIHRGLPLSSIARYVGDTEVTILRTYSHLINGMESLAASAMDDALG